MYTDTTVDAVLVEFLSAYQAGKEFAIEQSPILIQEILLYHGVTSFIAFCVSLVSMVLLPVLCIKFLDKKRKLAETTGVRNSFYYASGGANDGIAPIVAGTLGAMFALIFPIALNTDWIKILLAPRLYLLEYAAEIVK